MNEIRSILRAATKRLHLTAFLLVLHQVGLVVAGVALLIAVVGKTSPSLAVSWTWLAPVLAGAGLLVAALMWSTHRRTELQVAVEVDDRLELREKLSTALHVRDRDDTFARAAIEDAVTVARDPRTRERMTRGFAVTPPNRWWGTPVLVALAALAVTLLPQGDWFSRDHQEDGLVAFPQEVQETIDAAIEMAGSNPLLKEELEELLKLEGEELDPTQLKSPKDAKREALKRLTSLNDKIEDILGGEDAQKAKAIEKQLRQLEGFKSGPAKELADAMRRSDFSAAKKALEELQAKTQDGSMTDEQKEQLKEQLEKLAEQLGKLADQKRELEKALQEAGLDKNLAQNQNALENALKNAQNLTEQQKQQLQQMAQAQQAASSMCQGMGQAMAQMAGAMGAGNKPGQGAQQAGQMLSQLEAMQDMLSQCEGMGAKLAGMCQGLGKGLGGKAGLLAQSSSGAFGPMGRGAGGVAPKSKTPTRLSKEQVASDSGEGDVIASVFFDGPQIKGEAQASFTEVVRSAQESFAEKVTDGQVPRKYHETIKHFYGEDGLGGSGGSSGTAESSDAGDGAEAGGDD